MISVVHRVADQLRRAIRAGEYSVGDRLANERALAEDFGVSRGTIRQALGFLRRERLIVSQHGRGNFVADPAYAAVSGQQSSMMGLMVYEREYFFEPVVRGAMSQAAQRGYVLALGSNADEQDEQIHGRAFLASRVQGLLLAPRPGKGSAVYQEFLTRDCPVVLLDAMLGGIREDFVGCDEAWGMELAVRHLVDLGHRRITYVCPKLTGDIPFGPARRRGFSEAAASFDIPESCARIVYLNDDDYASILRNHLCRPDSPTGFVCYSDMWAARILEVAGHCGIAVPRELSIIGFDDSAIAKNASVRLTSINPAQNELGRAAIDLLIDKMNSPVGRAKRIVLVTPYLVKGDSTAPVSEADR